MILGNHDRGKDSTGETLLKQIRVLQEKYCAWDLKIFNNQLNIVSARPCSSGGGYFLSKEVEAVYGPISEQESVNKIIKCSEKTIKESPVNFATTSVFRVLSDEGCEALLDVSRKLEKFTTSSPRISRNVRGGVYRSRFLRDLCLSDEVSLFLSDIAGISLSPHTIPHQLGHINFNPLELEKNVDKWHVDTLTFDYVLFVTDPKKNDGGEFQYFFGTKDEMAELKKNSKKIPKNKIVTPEIPGPGFVVFQQGKHVVHRAKGLTSHGERITLVNGYMPSDPEINDYTKFGELCNVDPMEILSLIHISEPTRPY